MKQVYSFQYHTTCCFPYKVMSLQCKVYFLAFFPLLSTYPFFLPYFLPKSNYDHFLCMICTACRKSPSYADMKGTQRKNRTCSVVINVVRHLFVTDLSVASALCWK